MTDGQVEKQIYVEVGRKSAEGLQVHEERAVQVLTLAWFVSIYGGKVSLLSHHVHQIILGIVRTLM